MSNSVFNLRWAEIIIEALTRHGMKHICIAPGSRSTPLTLAAAKNNKLHCHTHFDERGLGHLALGLAKASLEPVGVIVTSGTAVANLYPSLIEAGLTGEKVIFLTADRPPELIDCGANQAIRQTHIFASHPAQSLMLPRPTRDISPKWLVSAIDNGMNQLRHGAFHINCPFAEPLYGETEGDYDWQQQLGNWWNSQLPWLSELLTNTVAHIADWYFWRQKKGVVIAGRMNAQEGEHVANWAKTLGWPLISDVLSQTGQIHPCADLWLAHPQAKAWLDEAELVIQFGSSLTGKRLLQWQAQCQPQEYWIIDMIPGRLDPANHYGRKLTCSIKGWLDAHPAQPRSPWCEKLWALTKRTQQHVTAKLHNQFSEAAVAHQLPQLLPPKGQLFVGNSLIVRLVDALAQLPEGYPVYSNRGASGIDGLISTMAGVQRATIKPTLGIVGDLSALYDLNSLALLRAPSAPTILIVVNNNGGQIFSMLPTPEEAREPYYCMPQNVNFEHAALMFGLQYAAPKDWLSLKTLVEQFWFNQQGCLLIELIVDSDEGARTLKQLLDEVGNL
ncbi:MULTISPECIES: 2-succinyl-5-enolpyruvyl-6-hydroxy-3-cyclohexene-1-carboxylic-acid synthase [Providencia]|uniref:2-succinyl-5-enolpyruvyl-6-hydroxy-3-cyclohexene-1-carboxylate synthase n=1 Tax=Providencia stuartii TaxID=588 RepID=A0ABD5L2S2_PROST|nr:MULTISPECIES: 2-succinyl-5-enolpyruvyl-6-hydroxy-3-cyclohexene-1-carboxylic-acid synthase [Providencia]ELR5045830.1 2-succinyl-5-enolpyruvyl-6-hydroxy-3-cyclohexene-1-carboxylic-acid synthase [Providencia rettgeri]ELR5290665.1 2-succinyl-5-enolpyruvyl-6-hydroxy-3-cyclohexene-1-carboxylic-acid synthase [Providencia stuartii]MCR4179180.1 2-succinyl-5-enolpyruvyl-6-hydroxy-3-cyclohexene-1-carboxylic-acid synthase [Providencia vermicola]URE80347.1 2-succinyl-5-enolpyruvyl-6-hydroxy-3-cyclohexene